ncbi:MAG TPA: GNAT family N-acetyltransferase [Paludibacteraceae bacterium]|nr:GNAT family N-acetyltransferase [Paludibacteraceae bacterium]HOS37465.1 GNAT family N-acetyltransferase [Paludibacteraceae bacterium]HPK20329.1 GNAT family N-acetyltransferase [Paludibacteraceae bacterium]
MIEKFKTNILTENKVLKPFESVDKDLNDFLANDAKSYSSSLLATTYLIENKEETIAYFSLLNDRILMDEEEKSIWNRINRLIANRKRNKSYPAVKIGRLAVSKKYAKSGIGKDIISFVQYYYTDTQQKAGCRFIIVDAYQSALGFYEKMGFQYLTTKDKGQATRSMFFDLKKVAL